MVVCRWWWCIEPCLVPTPDADGFVSMTWVMECVYNAYYYTYLYKYIHIYIFISVYIFIYIFTYCESTLDMYIYIYMHCIMWMYIGICFKTCVYPQLPCPMRVVMDDHFMIFPVGNFDTWTILIKVVVHILYKWGMPNPHEPQKHQVCFASNHKTLKFIETGNQSQRSPDHNLGLILPAATKQLVRSLRFFRYLAPFLLGLFMVFPEERSNPRHQMHQRLAKGHHWKKTKKRDPTWWLFFGGVYTPEN